MNAQQIIDLFIIFTIAITLSVTAIGLLPLA